MCGSKNIVHDKKILQKKALKKDKYESQKLIFRIDKNKSYFWWIKHSSWSWINDSIVFHDLIEVGKKIWIYDDNLKDKLHKLRSERNSIHLHTLEYDKIYEKDDLEYYFEISKELIHNFKIKMKNLK